VTEPTTKPWNNNGPEYRGHTKHKRRPGNEVKGTFCPEWTHQAGEVGFAHDPFNHDWTKTKAAEIFADSLPSPDGTERRYGTLNGVAFEAKPTNDGTWHGYPIPWQSVPTSILNAWKAAKKVKSRQVSRFWKDEGRIDWALDTD
jgi:hypothetical protein